MVPEKLAEREGWQMTSRGYIDFKCDYWCAFCGRKVPRGQEKRDKLGRPTDWMWTPASLQSEEQEATKTELCQSNPGKRLSSVKYIMEECPCNILQRAL